MGLALVKKIVENLGGSITIRSAKGSGTAFYFTLPARSGNFLS
jgi:signal transduction histidine kinase